MEDLLDIAGAAIKLNVPKSWLEDKVKARAVPFTKLGKHVRFAEHHLKQIVANGEEPVAKVPNRLQVVERTHPPSGPSSPPPPPGPKPARERAA